MKKILEKMMCFTMIVVISLSIVSGQTMSSVNAAGKKQAALKAYMKELNRASSNDMFFVHDLNHDGVPELVMRNGGFDPTIYTYYKNKVVKAGGFASGDILIYFKKGKIFEAGRLLGGRFYERIYTVSSGKIKMVASSTFMDDENASGEYYVGGKKTTKGKYEKYQKKMTKKSKSYDFKYYQATPANINKYCK